MTLLSLFMTSTGIFCFVPISQRLVESGIIPASNSWRFRRLPSVLAPTFYAGKEDRLQFLLSADEAGNAWSETEVSVSLVVAATRCNLNEQERHQMQSPLPQIPLYSADYTFTTDQQLALPCANESNIDIVSPFECSTTNSLLQSTSIDTFYGRESTSFISVGVVSDLSTADTSQTRLHRIVPSATPVTLCCGEKSLPTTFRASYAPWRCSKPKIKFPTSFSTSARSFL